MIYIPHIETDLTLACQLSCIACNHMVSLYRDQNYISHIPRADPEQIRHDLFQLTTILHAGRWGALGGEPTLHTQLPEILEIVRESGICDQIEVWTNGILPARWFRFGVREDFWEAQWDILVVSRYEGRLSDDDVKNLTDGCNYHDKQIEIKDERTWNNFRTNLEPAPTDPETTKRKFDGCFFRQFSRVVNNGYFYTCCCAPHMPRLLQGRPEGSDGIPVEGLTEVALQAYLTRSEPLGCCTICAGRDTAKPVKWREERDPEKWIQASKGLDR